MHNTSATKRADVVFVAVILLLLSCLLLPALAQSNSQADQSLCLRQMKELVAMLHNYHDTLGSFPLASTQPIDHKAGSSEEETIAGYSWLTKLTPFTPNGRDFWDVLSMKSKKLEIPPFNSELIDVRKKGNAVHLATLPFSEFVCPSSTGDIHVTENDSDYRPLNGGSLPAAGNYHAFAGSHFLNTEGLGRLSSPDVLEKGAAYEGDGALPFPGRVGGQLNKRGIGLKQISDGSSLTFVFAESIESAYAAWIDGQAMWLVAAWPGNTKLPTLKPVAGRRDTPVLGWEDADKKNVKIAVTLRNADGSPITYLPAGRWSGSKDRRWAASSNHPGLIGHAFADGHVEMLTPDIDPEVYLHLSTRNGREVAPQEARKKPVKPNVMPKAGQGRVRPHQAGSAVQMHPEQWSPIEWSPISIGDLRLYFPQLLALNDFRLDPTNRSLVQYAGQSAVFSSFVYDREKGEFRLQVSDRESTVAFKRIYKQLCDALNDPGSKDTQSQPNRVLWRKDAKWQDGAATFEFTLTEKTTDQPPSVIIRVIDSKQDAPDGINK